MKISREDVLHVAELAHLELPEGEVETLRKQLDSILTYIDKLNELDTSKVEPMAQVLPGPEVSQVVAGWKSGEKGSENTALREDTVVACGLAKEVLPGAPDPSPPYFRVPKVIER